MPLQMHLALWIFCSMNVGTPDIQEQITCSQTSKISFPVYYVYKADQRLKYSFGQNHLQFSSYLFLYDFFNVKLINNKMSM